MTTINLGDHRGEKCRVLSGVDLGASAREYFKIDGLDKHADSVKVIIPDYIYSVNSSYFSGLFQKSLVELKEAGFRAKYRFECDDIIRKNVENGIFNITKTCNIMERD